MLGLLPYDRLNHQQRDMSFPSSGGASDPFKAYNHRPTPQMPLHQPSYYAPFADPTSYIRAVELQRHHDAAASSIDSTKLDYHRLASSSAYSGTSAVTVSQPHGPYGSSFGFYNNAPSTPNLMNMFDATPTQTVPAQQPVQQLLAQTPAAVSGPGHQFTKSNNIGSTVTDTDCQYLPSTGHKDRASQQTVAAGQSGYVTGNDVGPSNIRDTASVTSSSSCDNSSPDGGGGATSFAGSRNRRSKKHPMPVPSELKDTHYWDKRKKNNESAKRSREARRRQESVLAKHLAGLEQEYVKLKADIVVFSNEIEQIRLYLMPGNYNDQSNNEKHQHHQHLQQQQQHLHQMQRHAGLI